jgi:2-polyprenyl-6-methoxyphenol hydroxylase-like FAD-dependent oxidoreductase
MKVLVRGAGLAGLTAARALAAFSPGGGALAVTVREARPGRLLPHDVGVGLWPAAQRALERLGAPGRRLTMRSLEVPPAAYRSSAGAWLAQSAGRGVRVRTICENELRSFLYEEEEEGGGGFRWRDKGVTFVHGGGGGAFDNAAYDLVIDATGGGSEGGGNASLGVSGIVTRAERATGGGSSKIRRVGGAELFQGLPPRPFETLVAPSVRVAVVPLSQDGVQFFWFVSGMEHVLPAHNLQASAPLSAWLNACARTIDASTHVPMSAIIAESSSMTIRRVCAGADTTHRSHENNVVRIGDAANHLPNNLAQGASVAIEDGHAIGSIVALAAAVHASEKGEETDMSDTVAACIEAFTRLRAPRVRDCRNISWFTQYISDYPGLAGCMRFVPAPINCRVFDAFLEASLGGGGSDPDSVLGPASLAGPVRVGPQSF